MVSPIISSISNYIMHDDNFLISGGAGSGKTYTLMEVLDYLHNTKPTSNIACITYTNAAVNVIKDRTPFSNIIVSTIHDFLWDTINNYQKNIKIALAELIENEKKEDKTGIKYSGEKKLTKEYFGEYHIQYKEYRKLEEGIISHNEVLKISNYLFKNYPLINEILIDKYDFILIDEYQDAEEQVMEIFLNYMQGINHKNNIVGAFGDSMQSIYDEGIGELSTYIENGVIKEIVKEDNWRCSTKVINLLNKLRNDIRQEQKGKQVGSIKFIYNNDNEIDIDKIKKNQHIFKDWDFSDFTNTKELYLTHNLIASKAGFGELFEIYNNDEIFKQTRKIRNYIKNHPEISEQIEEKTFQDVLNLQLVSEAPRYKSFIQEHQGLFNKAKKTPFDHLSKNFLLKENLIGDDKDFLINHLFKIQDVLHLYETNQVNAFINKTDFQIKSIQDKIDLKDTIEQIKEMKNRKIHEIIEYAHNNKLVLIDDNLNDFIREKTYIFDRVSNLKYTQLICLYNFEQNLTPYSTQHGIKGEEYENVFVILDNGRWSKYNFKYLFENTSGKESIIKRTMRMFYVCCSRSKNNLVVYYHSPSEQVLTKAREWFGESNVIKL